VLVNTKRIPALSDIKKECADTFLKRHRVLRKLQTREWSFSKLTDFNKFKTILACILNILSKIMTASHRIHEKLKTPKMLTAWVRNMGLAPVYSGKERPFIRVHKTFVRKHKVLDFAAACLN
jgi:predicted choloylglycine hydrolase